MTSVELEVLVAAAGLATAISSAGVQALHWLERLDGAHPLLPPLPVRVSMLVATSSRPLLVQVVMQVMQVLRLCAAHMACGIWAVAQFSKLLFQITYLKTAFYMPRKPNAATNPGKHRATAGRGSSSGSWPVGRRFVSRAGSNKECCIRYISNR